MAIKIPTIVVLFVSLVIRLSGDTVEIVSRIEDWSSLHNRIMITLPSCTLWSVQTKEEGMPWSCKFGVQTPVFSLGYVTVEGLLRETFDPGGFTPLSPVYRSTTLLSHDKDLSTSDRKGGLLSIIPDRLCLFTFGSEGQTVSAGVDLTLPFFDTIFIRVLGMGSFFQPVDENYTDVWFFEQIPYVDSAVYHLLIAGMVSRKPMRCRYAAGIALRRFGYPGSFVRAWWEVRNAYIEAVLLASLIESTYRNPLGNPGDYRFKIGGSIILLPDWVISPSIVLEKAVYILPVIPVPYRRESGDLRCSLLVSINPLQIQPTYRWNLDFSEQGDMILLQAFSTEIKGEFAAWSFSILGQYDWDYYGRSEKKLTGRCSLGKEPMKFRLSASTVKNEDWNIEAKLSCVYRSVAGNGTITLALEETDLDSLVSTLMKAPFFTSFSLSFGWQTEQSLPPLTKDRAETWLSRNRALIRPHRLLLP